MPKPGYTDPELMHFGSGNSKVYYVAFWFTCPVRMKRKQFQKRGDINAFRTNSEKEVRGKAFVSILNEALKDGWNPFDEEIQEYVLRTQENTEQEDALEKMSFISAIDFALQKKAAVLKPKSLIDYSGVMKVAKASAAKTGLANLPIGQIRKADIKKLLEQMAKDRQEVYNKQGKGKYFTPNAYNKYKSYISAILDELCEWDAVEYNPCEKIRDKDEIDTGMHRHATEQEVEIIKKHLLKNVPDLYDFLRFEYVTGMRPKEILAVTGSMIDWVNSYIKISFMEGKTKIFRQVPVPGFLLLWLRERLTGKDPSWFIFGQSLQVSQKPARRNWVSILWWKEIKKKLGIDVSLYSFKGLGGDAKRDAGIDLNSVAVGFGHTSTRTTKIYLRKEGERMRKEIIEKAPDL